MMPGKSKSRPPLGSAAEMRGVIDQFEGDVAIVVFDDDQRLDWPRQYLPPDARSGDAVIVRVAEPHDARWTGEIDRAGRVRLAANQSLQWPAAIEAGAISLAVEIDAEDTAARKERVRNLIDDIFKKKPSE